MGVDNFSSEFIGTSSSSCSSDIFFSVDESGKISSLIVNNILAALLFYSAFFFSLSLFLSLYHDRMTSAFLRLLVEKKINIRISTIEGSTFPREEVTSLWDSMLEDCIHRNIAIDRKSLDNLDNREESFEYILLYTMFEQI